MPKADPNPTTPPPRPPAANEAVIPTGEAPQPPQKPKRKRASRFDDPPLRSHAFDMLPFVDPRNSSKGRLFWAPRPTGDHEFDYTLGENYAEAMVPLLRRPDINLLRLVVVDVLRYGDHGRDAAVLAGMFSRLELLLKRSWPLIVPYPPKGDAA